jgi:hypothetical protein
LVAGDLVIVGVAGRLAAYDRVTGAPRWLGPSHGVGYSSPRLLTIDGVAQVLLLSATGATSVALADGALLWEHAWKGYPIVQPNLTAEGDVLDVEHLLEVIAELLRRLAHDHRALQL